MKIRAVVFVLLLILILSACTDKTLSEPTDILARIMELYPECGRGVVYFSEAEQYEKGWLDSDIACYMYTGKHGSLELFDRIEKYAVRISSGIEVFEVHIFEMMSEDDVSDAEKVFDSRIKMMQSSEMEIYDYDGYYNTIVSAQVYSRGRYVFLLITSDNNAAREVIERVM